MLGENPRPWRIPQVSPNTRVVRVRRRAKRVEPPDPLGVPQPAVVPPPSDVVSPDFASVLPPSSAALQADTIKTLMSELIRSVPTGRHPDLNESVWTCAGGGTERLLTKHSSRDERRTLARIWAYGPNVRCQWVTMLRSEERGWPKAALLGITVTRSDRRGQPAAADLG